MAESSCNMELRVDAESPGAATVPRLLPGGDEPS